MTGTPTPGPWQADLHHTAESAGRTYGWVRGGNQLVPLAGVTLGVEGLPRDEGHAEGRANAHLIAAAPDLREALQDAEYGLIAAASLAGLVDGSDPPNLGGCEPSYLNREGMCGEPLCDEGGCVVERIARVRAALSKALGSPKNQGDAETP